MKKYRIAAILMIIHGGLEICGGLALIPVLAMGTDSMEFSHYFSFIVPYLQKICTLC